MRKIATIAVVLCSLSVFADEVPGFVVNKIDGSKVVFETKKLGNIKFAGGNMIVSMKDDSQQTLSLADVTNIVFENVPTAIRNIMDIRKGGQIVVADLSGKVVYKGGVEGIDKLSNLRGVYVVTVNGISYKVSTNK